MALIVSVRQLGQPGAPADKASQLEAEKMAQFASVTMSFDGKCELPGRGCKVGTQHSLHAASSCPLGAPPAAPCGLSWHRRDTGQCGIGGAGLQHANPSTMLGA